MIRIGINGFGRIGRYLLRVMHLFPQCEVVVINGHRASNEEMAYLLKYDSVHGRFPGKVESTENGIRLDGREIIITRCDKGAATRANGSGANTGWTSWWTPPAR